MKTLSLATSLLIAATPVFAALNIPSDGSDGAFNPSVDTEIDLGQATTGTWSDDNGGSDIGKGVYDPQQWVVVYEYSSVNIPSGVTVTFKNHPSNAPVMWLVSGSVTIDGTVDLSGTSVYEGGLEGLAPSTGGPGGFRGAPSGPEGSGAGLGPGGAGAAGGSSQPVYKSGTYEYGNPKILPLIGGSGGSGSAGTAGSGGGGALLIASSTQILVNGNLIASGGDSYFSGSAVDRGYDRRGSGGSLRLIADQVSGSGFLDCRGGFWNKSSPIDTSFSQGDAFGRIRIETNSLSTSLITYPETVAVAPNDPVLLFPPANAPTVEIISVNAINAPVDPTAPLQASSDIAIQNDEPVTIIVQTTNFPLEGVVQVRVGQKFGGAEWKTATNIGGTLASATWQVTHTFADGFSALQARATAP